MNVIGIDFTSRPSGKKPITCARCRLNGQVLTLERLDKWANFSEFEKLLSSSGPWIAGIDFPFGQARKFVEGVGWPQVWEEYVALVGRLSRDDFRTLLTTYKSKRAFGDKEHRRAADKGANSISPQKLYGVPVGLMFYEGAPRLLNADVTIPGLKAGRLDKIVVEAYPGILARQLIGRASYKHDSRSKQTELHRSARFTLLDGLVAGGIKQSHGLLVQASRSIADDPTGDQLDAMLCAVQAAWSWTQRHSKFGLPNDFDGSEGWIFDPAVGSAI